MKAIVFSFLLITTIFTGYSQDITLDDFTGMGNNTPETISSAWQGKGFTPVSQNDEEIILSKESDQISIRKAQSGYSGLEFISSNKALYNALKTAAGEAYGKPEEFVDNGVKNKITEYIIDEEEFILFYIEKSEKSTIYHIGYGKH